MHLHMDLHTESRMGIAQMLTDVGARIALQPELVARNYLGNLVLRCPIPPGYQPSMNRAATHLQARITDDGLLFEIAEISDNVSAGWMASCIPTAAVATFLRAWLHHTAPQQQELFA